jgi:predicted metal-dependent hydrolase
MTETRAAVDLPGGTLPYTLRRHPRSRRLRVTIDAHRGLVVSVPPAARRGWARPERAIEAFLGEREAWIRRHLAALARQRALAASRRGLGDGASLPFRGEPHRIRIRQAARGTHRSVVLRVGGEEGDELIVVLATRDRRPIERVLRDWLVERARLAVDEAVTRHASSIGVSPAAIVLRDPRSRWGSATPAGRVMLSWRLVIAQPQALETVVVHELAHLREAGHGAAFWALVASRIPDHRAWRRWLREHAVELHACLEPA